MRSLKLEDDRRREFLVSLGGYGGIDGCLAVFWWECLGFEYYVERACNVTRLRRAGRTDYATFARQTVASLIWTSGGKKVNDRDVEAQNRNYKCSCSFGSPVHSPTHRNQGHVLSPLTPPELWRLLDSSQQHNLAQREVHAADYHTEGMIISMKNLF